jgi:sulfur-carrier protein
MATGVIRYWAAARDAAGTSEEPYDATTLAEALHSARQRHDEKFSEVLARCSFLVNDSPVGGRDHARIRLPESGTIEVLPPFAGG